MNAIVKISSSDEGDIVARCSGMSPTPQLF